MPFKDGAWIEPTHDEVLVINTKTMLETLGSSKKSLSIVEGLLQCALEGRAPELYESKFGKAHLKMARDAKKELKELFACFDKLSKRFNNHLSVKEGE